MADSITGTRRIYEGWFAVEMLTIALDSGETIEREIVVHPSGATVLAYDRDRRVAMLVSEARPPLLREGAPRVLEAIAGKLDEADPEACARREAMEEGGLALDTLIKVGTVWMTPSTSTEQVHLYLASYSRQDRAGEGGGLDEEQEHLRIREVPLADLARLGDADTPADAKTLLLVQALRLREPELFA